MSNLVKNIAVMNVKQVKVNGKLAKSIKMLDWPEDVMKYLEVSTADKVKQMIMDNIRVSGVFGDTDVKDLWYKWDAFMDSWKKRRADVNKKKRAVEDVKEVEDVLVDFDVKEELTGEMKEEFMKLWKKQKMAWKKQKKAKMAEKALTDTES